MSQKISVIVPVYNVEKYLNRCVDSIINQTYKNLEIILVDDGSPDNCSKICDEYANKDRRIKVVHKENGGLPSARNTGVENATGDYITFVDSDDWIDINMYNNMMSHNRDYDIIRTEFIKHDGTKELFKSEPPYNTISLIDCSSNRNELFELLYRIKMHANICCMLMKKTIIDLVYPFEEAIQLGEDLLIAVSLFCVCRNVLFIPKHYYYYFQNLGSLTKSKERMFKNIDDLLLLREKIYGSLERFGNNNNELIEAFNACVFVKCGRFLMENRKDNELKKYVNYMCNNPSYQELIQSISFRLLNGKEKLFYLLSKKKMINTLTLMLKTK